MPGSLAVLPISPMPVSRTNSSYANAINSTVSRIEDDWEEVDFGPDNALFSLEEFENDTNHLEEKLKDIKKNFEAFESQFSKLVLSSEEIAQFKDYLSRQGFYLSHSLHLVRELASNPDALDDPDFKALIKPDANDEVAILKGLKKEIKAFMREVGVLPVKSYKKVSEGLTIGLPVSGAIGYFADSALLGGFLTMTISVIKSAIFFISGKEKKKAECKEMIREISQSLVDFLDERIDMSSNTVGQTTAATYMQTTAIRQEIKQQQDTINQAAEHMEEQANAIRGTESAINNAAGALTSLEIKLIEENKQLKKQLEEMQNSQERLEKSQKEEFASLKEMMRAALLTAAK